MISARLLSLVFIFVGAIVQIYALASGLLLVTDTSRLRYVPGNEFSSVWTSISAILATWTSIHMVVWSHSSHSSNKANKGRINWLPTGIRPHVAFWIIYVVLLTSLATAASTLLYDQQTTEKTLLTVFGFIFPLVSSVITLPKMIEKIHKGTAIRRKRGDTEGNESEDDQDDNKSSIYDKTPIIGIDNHNRNTSSTSLVASQNTPNPKSPANISVISNQTRQSRASDYTRFSNSPGKLSSNPSYRIGSPSLHDKSMPALSGQHAEGKFKRTVISVFEYKPLAVLSSVLSALIYILLCNAAFQQHQHIKAAPKRYAVPVVANVAYTDNIDRQLHISVRCKGPIPPSFTTSSNTIPQRATIVIEHMAGYPSLVSKSIQDALIQQNRRVCVYDRPGYMLSPQGFFPAPLAATQQALLNALVNSGEKGPFYLVGHYSGSEYAELFLKENRRHVVGMALVYPTDKSLLGLLDTKLEKQNRTLIASGVVHNRNEFIDLTGPISYLNFQRAFASLGIWSTSIPITSDPNDNNNVASEWALSSPDLSQAQFFEIAQQPLLADAIMDLDTLAFDEYRIPVLLMGLKANETAQAAYLSAVGSKFKVEISDPAESQPLGLNRIAQQISWHISRLF